MNVPKMQFFCKNDLLMIFFWEKVNKHKFIKINSACAFVVATCSVCESTNLKILGLANFHA